MSATPNPDMPPLADSIHDSWGWFVTLGIVLIVLGILTFSTSVMTTVITVGFLGGVMLVAGLFQFIHAFWVRNWSGFFVSFMSGLLLLVVGFLMLTKPLLSAASLTILLAAYFFMTGLVRIVQSLIKRFDNWGWALFSGVVSLILGLIVWAQWPYSSLYLIGLFVSIELMLLGVTWTALGVQAHRIQPRGFA